MPGEEIYARISLDYSALSEGLRVVGQELKSADSAVESTAGAIGRELSQAFAHAGQEARTATQAMPPLREQLSSLGEAASQVGASLSIGITAPLTALGKLASDASASFETAMANVWTIADVSREELQALGDQIERLSTEVPQSATQLAEGLYDAIGSGITNVTEAMQVLEIAAKAGMAGASNTQTAMDALTTVLNSYGMAVNEAGNITDMMFRTVDRGKISFEELAGSIADVASTAATAGVSFDEIAASFATLTKGGVSASEAATAVNQALLSIIQPSEQAAEYAKQLGIEFNASALESKGLVGVLQDVYEATGGNIESMATLFNNVRALKGVLGLIRNDMQDYTSDLEAMAQASGATEAAFSKQMQTSAAQAALFKNEVTALARAMGDELWPILNGLMDAVEPLIDAFKELPEGTREAIVGFSLFAAALGPVTAGIGAVIGYMTGPAGWVLAIGAVGAALYGLISNITDVEGAMERKARAAREAARETEEAADAAIDQAEALKEQGEALSDLVSEYEKLAGKPYKSEEEHKRLQQVMEAIIALQPDLAAGYDNIGEAIERNLPSIKSMADEMVKQSELMLQAEAQKAQILERTRNMELMALSAEKEKLLKATEAERAESARAADMASQAKKLYLEMQMLESGGLGNSLAAAEATARRLPVVWDQLRSLFRQSLGVDVEEIVSQVEGRGIQVTRDHTWFTAYLDNLEQKAVAESEDLALANKRITAIDEEIEATKQLISIGQELQDMWADYRAGLDPWEERRKREAASSGGTATGTGTRDGSGLPPVKPPDLSEFEKWGQKVKQLSQEAYSALQAEWLDIEKGLKAEDDPVAKRWAEMRASALLSAIDRAIAQFGNDFDKAAAAASVEVESGYKTIRDRFAEETTSLSGKVADDFEAFGKQLAGMADDALTPLKIEWTNIAATLADESALATDRTWAEARARALVQTVRDTLLRTSNDSAAAFAAAKKVLEDGYAGLWEEPKTDTTEFERWTEKIMALSRERYATLQDEWAKIEEGLESGDAAERRWAQARAQALVSVINNAIDQFAGDWSKAADAAVAEVESGYATIMERFARSTSTLGAKVASQFESLGKELEGMADPVLEPLKAEWKDILETLESTTAGETQKLWATARLQTLTRIIESTIAETSGDRIAAFKTAAKELESGYQSLTTEVHKGQSELAKTMAEFRYYAAVGMAGYSDTAGQISQLTAIKETDAYKRASIEEQRQLEIQLYNLQEELRQNRIRSAYEEYQLKAELLDYEAADRLAHLQRLLADETLTDEERRKLQAEYGRWTKKQLEEEAAYKKTVNDAWNTYYLQTGRETQADLLREKLAAAEAELDTALKTGQKIQAAEVAVAQARAALNAQLRKDDEERLQFQIAMGAMTTQEQLAQIQKWLAAEEAGQEHWKELTLAARQDLLQREKALVLPAKMELFDLFRAEQDFAKPLTDILREQAEWLQTNIVAAEGLNITLKERAGVEQIIYDLALKRFNQAAQEGKWTAVQQQEYLAAYMSEYVTNTDLRMKYAELEASINARAAEEIARSKDEAFAKALKAADEELKVTEKSAEAQKAAWNRVMDERLPIAERTAEAIEAINQRNRVFDFQIQEEATKKAQEAADERVAIALKEADAKLRVGLWGFEEYQKELDRLLAEEINMSNAARTKIADKEWQLWVEQELARQAAVEQQWQDEIDAAVAGWDQKLKLEKNGAEAQAQIAKQASEALQLELEKRLANETITAEQAKKLRQAISDFNLQAQDKELIAQRQKWDEETNDYLDELKRRVANEGLAYDLAAQQLQEFLDSRIAAKTITYSQERTLLKQILDWESKARAEEEEKLQKEILDSVSADIDASRKRMELAKETAKAQGTSYAEALEAEADALEESLNNRIHMGEATVDAIKKMQDEIGDLRHQAELEALRETHNAADAAVAAKLDEVRQKVKLDKQYNDAALQLQAYLNEERTRLTAQGIAALEKAISDYDTQARLQEQAANEAAWKSTIDNRVKDAKNAADMAKLRGESYAAALREQANELEKFLAQQKAARQITAQQEQKLLDDIADMRRQANLEALKESNDAADQVLAKHIESVEYQLKIDKDYAAARRALENYAGELTVKGREALAARLEKLKTDEALYQRQVNADLAQDEIRRIQNLITAQEVSYAKAAELLQAWVNDNARAGDDWADARKKALDKADEWDAKARGEAKTQAEKEAKEAIERADAQAKAEYDAVLKESEAYPEAVAKYQNYLSERQKAYISYSREWLEIQKEIDRVEKEKAIAAAQAIANQTADLEDLTKESIKSARERLLAERATYEGMGDAGAEAVRIIQKALDELTRTEQNLFKERALWGKLTTEEQLAQVQEWRAASKEGSSEWLQFRQQELELVKQLQKEQAEATVERLMAGIPEDTDDLVALETALQNLRNTLGTYYDKAKSGGVEMADAMTVYEKAIRDVNSALKAAETEAERSLRAQDEEMEERYRRGQLIREEYSQYLEGQIAELEAIGQEYSNRGIDLAKNLSRVMSDIYKVEAQAAIDALGDLETVNIATARKTLEALKATYAGYIDGAAAVKLLDDALAKLTKREEDYAKELERVGKQAAEAYEERLALIIQEGEALMARARALRPEDEAEWTLEDVRAYNDGVAKILDSVTKKAAKLNAERANEQVAAAKELAKTNLVGAIDTLEAWLNTTAGVGDAWIAAREIVGKALDELKGESEDAATSIERLLMGPLQAALAGIDNVIAEYRAKVKVGYEEGADITPAQLDRAYQLLVAEAVEKYLQSRIKSIDSMKEAEITAAEETLEATLKVIAEKVGAESEAAAVILAIREELNERSKELADQRLEHEREVEMTIAELRGEEQEAFALSIEQKIAALRKAGWSELEILRWAAAHGNMIRQQAADADYELRKKLGLLSVEEQIAYEQEKAERAKATEAARLDAAADYYSALESLIRDAEIDELASIKRTLQAQLAKYEAMGEGASAMALAVKAALKLIDQETAKTIADVTREITNAIADLSELFGADSEVQSGLQDLSGAVADAVKAFAAFAAGDIASGIASAVSAFVKLDSAIANLSPSIRAAREEYAELAEQIRQSLAGLERFERRSSTVQLSETARRYQEQLEAWEQAAEERANAGFLKRVWWALTGSAPDAGTEAGREAAQAFVEAWSEIAGALDSGVQSAMSSAIKAFLDGTETIAEALRRGIRDAIVEAITQAAVQGAIIQGALGALLTELTDELAQRQWDAAAETIRLIAEQIPEVAAELEQILAPLSEALNEAFPSDVGSSGGGSSGTQISEITGPSRDLLVETLRPLQVLDSLPVYAAAIELAIYEMRDAFLAYVGMKAAAEAGAAAVHNEYHINTINIYSSGQEDFDQLMASLGRRADLATIGSGA